MAAYNGGYPAAFAPMYYQPQYQAQQQTQQQSNNIIWIQGEAAAKSYLVAPNNSIVLFDSESQTIYIKSADASGMPSMKILDYTIRNQTPGNGHVAASTAPGINPTDYATRAEFDGLRDEINALKAQMKKGAALNE